MPLFTSLLEGIIQIAGDPAMVNRNAAFIPQVRRFSQQTMF